VFIEIKRLGKRGKFGLIDLDANTSEGEEEYRGQHDRTRWLGS
jgi:hypothetical protein